MKRTLAILALMLAVSASTVSAAPATPVKYNYCLQTRPAQCITLPKALGQRVDKIIFKMPARHGAVD